MTIQELKQQIEKSIVSESLIIFNCSKGDAFIAFQYINAIAGINGRTVSVIDDISDLLNYSAEDELFGADDDDMTLKVYSVDKFDCSDIRLIQQKNLIIVVSDKMSADSQKAFANNIVDVLKLEPWQIKDFMYSSLPTVKPENLNWLQSVCNNDIYRINSEIDRIKIFNKNDYEAVFESFYLDGIYSDLTAYTIFNLTNAIQSRDVVEIKKSYINLNNLDNSDMLFYSVLCNSFRNLIQVQLGNNVTSSDCNLTDKQIYAIKKLPKIYTEEQLIKIYMMLTDISMSIRMGTMLTGINLVDYIIIKILSA